MSVLTKSQKNLSGNRETYDVTELEIQVLPAWRCIGRDTIAEAARLANRAGLVTNRPVSAFRRPT